MENKKFHENQEDNFQYNFLCSFNQDRSNEDGMNFEENSSLFYNIAFNKENDRVKNDNEACFEFLDENDIKN